IAVASAVFAAYGHLGTPASVTGGFKPALAACAGFALLAALSALAITAPKAQPAPAHAEGGPPARPEPATAAAVAYPKPGTSWLITDAPAPQRRAGRPRW